MKILITADDGSEVTLFDQAHVDAAVAAAIAALPAPAVAVTDTEIVEHSDGSEEVFNPKA